MDRAFIAFLVASLAGPILYGGTLLVEGSPIDSNLVFIVGVSAIFSFGGVFFLGLPAYSFLLAKKWTAFWIAPLVGLIVATVTWYVFNLLLGLALVPDRSYVLSHLTDSIPFEGVLWPIGPIGVVVGALLWLIARPDQPTIGGNTENNR